MPTRKTTTDPSPLDELLARLSQRPEVHVIEPTAVYTVDEAQRLLRLKSSTIRREVREGRLRISKRAGRYYLLGDWLLEWLRAGELKRRRPEAAGNGATDGTPAGRS